MPGEVLVDWLYELWAYQYWRIVVSKFIFWLIFLCTDVPCLVDFAWVFNHVLLGTSLYIQYACCTPQSIVLFILLILWGCRLGGFLLFTRVLINHKDQRYEEISKKAKNRKLYFFINFQFQGFLVMLCGSNLYYVFRRPDRIGWYFWLGIALIAVGIIGEGIGDQQLQNYKNSKKTDVTLETTTNNNQIDEKNHESGTKKKIFQDGLWQYSRHPNLFFELVTWIGFAFTGLANDEWEPFFGFIAPIILYCIMNFMTVPITEKSMRDTRPDYKDFCKRTNKYIPFCYIPICEE